MSRIHNVFLADPDDPSRQAGMDSAFKSLIWIDIPHHEIHDGHSFILAATQTALGDGDTFTLTCTTPNTTKWLHSVFGGIGLYEYYLKVYENPTVDTPGSAVTPVNRNRNSANTSGATFTVDDVLTSPGTLIFENYVTSGRRVGGLGEQRQEYILKQNEQYVFHLESDRAANILTGVLEWYEHTNS